MLNGSTSCSLLDCTSGYYYIALSPKLHKKFVFVSPIGTFEFKKVPFGLDQTPDYFPQLINEVFNGLPFTFGNLDDILVFSKNTEKYFDDLRAMFNRLRKAKLKSKRKQSHF